MRFAAVTISIAASRLRMAARACIRPYAVCDKRLRRPFFGHQNTVIAVRDALLESMWRARSWPTQ